jgi:hypothetical protein
VTRWLANACSAIAVLALAACASRGAQAPTSLTPPASTAAPATSASSPGGGLDRGLDGSAPSGKDVALESQVGAGYLIDAVVVISTQPSPGGQRTQSPGAFDVEVAHVEVAVHDGSFQYSSAQFTFVTPSGQRFEVATDNAFPPALGNGTATAGQTVTGNVVFHVPPGGGTVELRDANGPRLWGWTTKHS